MKQNLILVQIEGVFMFDNISKKINNGQTVTLTFVGDSITEGTAHCTNDETFVAVFAKLMAESFPETQVVRYDGKVVGEIKPLDGYNEVLVQKGNKGRINVLRSGVGGNTIVRAMNRFNDYTGVLPCGTRSDYIFLMFGINDSITAVEAKYVTDDVFKIQYSQLVDKISESEPQAKIIVMPATTNDFSIHAHVKRTFEMIDEKDLLCIDTYKLWQDQYDETAENFGHGDWLVGGVDACHPTPKASAIMAEYIFEDFKKL